MPPTSRLPIAIVGGGAVGCSAALHLAQAGLPVIVFEKEPTVARHQSGRNSGVLHAGYNLKPGSLKARYCAEGNRQARAFCAEHGVAVQDGGILVVARTEPEREVLAELKRRADLNGVQARRLDAAGLREREPHAAGLEALLAPEAASIDAPAFVDAMRRAAQAAGAEFRFRAAGHVRAIRDEPAAPAVRIHVAGGPPVEAAAALNAGGLHADRLAATTDAALAQDVRVVPFRGYYAELAPEKRGLVRSHIYAAPDLAFPFLGVHLSRRTDGRTLVGPGAMLALGRQAYSLARGNPRDLAALASWPGFWRMLGDPRMRHLARTELHKSLSLAAIAREAAQLVPGIRARDLRRAMAGNRAQLVDRAGRLVDDILVRETPRSVHVLNVVSPGLTSSLPFGAHLAWQVAQKL